MNIQLLSLPFLMCTTHLDTSISVINKIVSLSGVDPALSAPDGSCLAVESYLHKGRLTVASRCKRKDIPGLWVAGECSTEATISVSVCDCV